MQRITSSSCAAELSIPGPPEACAKPDCPFS